MIVKFNDKEYKLKTWQLILIGIFLIAIIRSSWEDSKYAGVIYGRYDVTSEQAPGSNAFIELYKNSYIRLHVDMGNLNYPTINRTGHYTFDSSASALKVTFSDGQPPYSFPMEKEGDLWTIKSGSSVYHQDEKVRKFAIYYADNAQEIESH